MDVKSGYKHTEVGVVPEDWCVDTLGSHVDITSGESPSRFHFTSEGIPYFKVDQINNNNKQYLSDTPYFIQGNRKVSRGSLIFPKRGASILLNKVRILAEDSFMDTNLMTLTPRVSVHLEFLYYALTHIELWRIADVTSIPQINNKHIVSLLVPLPPTHVEQEAIAGALSDADALIESLEQLLTKKRQIKQGAMQDLLTGKKRLPGFSGKWKVETFGKTFQYYATATNSRSDLLPAGNTFYVHYGDIHTRFHNHLDFSVVKPPRIDRSRCSNATLLKNGDWVMVDASEDHEGVGKAIEIQGLSTSMAAVAGLHTFLLREKKPTFSPGFKGHLGNLKSLHDQFLRVATGMKVFGVSKAALKDIELPVPHPKEQIAIAAILTDMDEEIAALETKLTKARQFKQGMMQELLTGRIRLI